MHHPDPPDHKPSVVLTVHVVLGPPGGPHELHFIQPHNDTELITQGTCRQLAQLASAAVANSLISPPPDTVPAAWTTNHPAPEGG